MGREVKLLLHGIGHRRAGSLAEAGGTEALRISYSDDWYPATDGGGRSLQLDDLLAAGEALGEPASWRPSSVEDGTPGFADPGIAEGGRQRAGNTAPGQ